MQDNCKFTHLQTNATNTTENIRTLQELFKQPSHIERLTYLRH